MIKTYRLNIVEEKQITDTEGRMTFHLIDEDGNYRTVWGNTVLDEKGESISIIATKKREHPLLQCLFKSEPNDMLKIDFTQYNDVFEREDEDKPTPTVDELMKEMQDKPMRIGALLEVVE
jgi:hypothetical protein